WRYDFNNPKNRKIEEIPYGQVLREIEKRFKKIEKLMDSKNLESAKKEYDILEELALVSGITQNKPNLFYRMMGIKKQLFPQAFKKEDKYDPSLDAPTQVFQKPKI
ncbi:MAG: hypothetical protein ACW96X_12820, partial [Promethearchaeota archaeon]